MTGTRRRRPATALGAALLVAAVTGCGTVSDEPPTTVSGRAASPSTPVAPGAVWPSRDGSALMALQDLTDRGRRPDLLDPVAVARQYAADAMPGAPALRRAGGVPTMGPFTSTGPTTGEVPVTGPGLSPSTVYLRRLEPDAVDPKSGRQQSIWYIQGIGTPALAVLDVDYDGQRLVASFIPASNGTLTVRVTGLDERLLAEQVTSTRTGRLNPVDIDAPGQPALVVSATLALADGSIAPREFRIGAPPAAAS
jgi:hypothetical protein